MVPGLVYIALPACLCRNVTSEPHSGEGSPTMVWHDAVGSIFVSCAIYSLYLSVASYGKAERRILLLWKIAAVVLGTGFVFVLLSLFRVCPVYALYHILGIVASLFCFGRFRPCWESLGDHRVTPSPATQFLATGKQQQRQQHQQQQQQQRTHSLTI